MNINLGSQMDKELSNMLINQFIKDSFWMEWNMDLENGNKIQIIIKINEINIKVFLWNKENMDLEYLCGNQGIFIKDNFKMIKDKDLDKWNGQMEVYILEFGKREFKMDMVECYLRQDK